MSVAPGFYLKRLLPFCAATLFILPLVTHAKISARSDVKAFISEMVDKHGFKPSPLTETLDQATIREDIIKAMSRPAENLPWHKYRPIFLTSQRVQAGADFYQRYETDLQRAEREYGVPAEIIVAILGVETRYGKYKGGYPVLDSLATLAFAYPKRAAFFRKELESYLLLTREENIDPSTLTGSYAGAMGHPQFIASSYRHYAIDFSGDGKRDLLNNAIDAIGSIANYFKAHGWHAGEPVANMVTAKTDRYRALKTSNLKPQTPVKAWQAAGIEAKQLGNEQQVATLVELDTTQQPELWLGYHNFYVITRYNHSELYAMAVYQLSQAIQRERLARLATDTVADA